MSYPTAIVPHRCHSPPSTAPYRCHLPPVTNIHTPNKTPIKPHRRNTAVVNGRDPPLFAVVEHLLHVNTTSIWENGISKLLEWNNALLKVISKVGLVDLMADNPKVKPAVVKEKPDDVTSKVSKGKELDVLKYKRKIEKESNALDDPNDSDKGLVLESQEIHLESQEIQLESQVRFKQNHIDGIHHEDDDGDDDDDGGNASRDTFRCKFFLWKEERVRLRVGSPGASTTLIYSPGSSSTPIYSPGSSSTPTYSPGSSTSPRYSLGA
nr:hypothetical protein [Tanacetum cinerariifolium]